jgi:hypothetical protein
MALFQELPIATAVMRPRGITKPALLQNLAKCQYRVFLDDRTFTFHEDDFITGGVVTLLEYKALGITRQEAIAELELALDRVWLAKKRADGTFEDPVEQPLMRTAYKDVDSAVLGQSVFQHRAFIKQLAPGEYESRYVSTHPDFPPFTATVRLIILPR